MGLYVIDAEGNRVLIAGSSGPAGADGKDGKSAYDYAVAGGYTGTEEEFQALLGTGPWIPTAGRLIGEYTEVFNQSVAAAKVGAYVKSHFEGGWHKISDQTDPDVECTHVEGFANAINAKVRATYPGEIYGIHAEGSENLVDFEGSYYTNITLSPYSSDTVYTACGSGIHVEGYDNSVYGLPSGAHVDGQSNMVSATDKVRSVFVSGCDNDISLLCEYSCPGITILGTFNKLQGNWHGDNNHSIFVLGNNNEIGATVLVDGASSVDYRDRSLSGDIFMIGHGLGSSSYTEDVDPSGIGKVYLGAYNNNDNLNGSLIVGVGSVEGFSTNRKNGLRVTSTNVVGLAYQSTGADYAEMFEWLDGNPDAQDRVGRFVTLDGDKLRLAGPDDDFILGIVSGNPSIVGDVYDDQWVGKEMRDIFGRPVWEEIDVPDEVREVPAKIRRVPDPEHEGRFIEEVVEEAHKEIVRRAHKARVLKLNPEYDETQKYLPRSDRAEWDTVGMMGKLVALDDGTCQVNGWCAPGENGAATASAERTKYRVMARLDDSHIRVLVL